MPILYNARRHHREAEERFNARYCDLDTLLQEADFVCLILPLTEETHHLIGKAQFAKMKKSAIFINAGRGPVVDEKALIEALQNGEIHAAGLDVFEQEPLPVDSPLLACQTWSPCPISAQPPMRPATTWRPPRWITLSPP
jgi:gluconate 2-dehydrogenase